MKMSDFRAQKCFSSLAIHYQDLSREWIFTLQVSDLHALCSNIIQLKILVLVCKTAKSTSSLLQSTAQSLYWTIVSRTFSFYTSNIWNRLPEAAAAAGLLQLQVLQNKDSASPSALSLFLLIAFYFLSIPVVWVLPLGVTFFVFAWMNHFESSRGRTRRIM